MKFPKRDKNSGVTITNFVVGFGFRVNSRRHPSVYSLSTFQYAIGKGTAIPTGLAFALPVVGLQQLQSETTTEMRLPLLLLCPVTHAQRKLTSPTGRVATITAIGLQLNQNQARQRGRLK